MSTLDEILAGYDGLQAGQEAFYKDLHEHPGLSHQEHRTAQCVAGQLQKDGFTVQTGIGGTGVVGVLANGGGPTVLLRCELDALPLREDTGAPYASTVTAQDANGHEVPVAHACGHDMHMSCMAGMAKLMADHPQLWNGTLIALFQPAEESGDGAQAMVDDGLLNRIAAPDVALAQHALPGPAGTVGTHSGPFMATEDSINLTVFGRGGHGAMPQHTIDPVALAAMIIVRLPRRRAGRASPGSPHQPLPEIPASLAAHLADRYRGPDRSRPGLARTAAPMMSGPRRTAATASAATQRLDLECTPESTRSHRSPRPQPVSWPEPWAPSAWTPSGTCGTAAAAGRTARWHGNSRRSTAGIKPPTRGRSASA